LHPEFKKLFGLQSDYKLHKKFLYKEKKLIVTKIKVRYIKTQAIKPKQSRPKEFRTKGVTHV